MLLCPDELFAWFKERSCEFKELNYPKCDQMMIPLLVRLEQHPDLAVVYCNPGKPGSVSSRRFSLTFAVRTTEALDTLESEYLKLYLALKTAVEPVYQIQSDLRHIYDEYPEMEEDTIDKLGRNYCENYRSVKLVTSFANQPSRHGDEYVSRTLMATFSTENAKLGFHDTLNQVFFVPHNGIGAQ